MKENIRKELLIISMIMLILANAANGGLSIFSFQKLYVDSLISGYKAVAKDLLNNVGGFEKAIEKSVGINRMIQELKHKNPDFDNVTIALPDGKILYSTDAGIINKNLPESLKTDFNSTEKKKKVRNLKQYIPIGNKYHILLPINDKTPKWAGTVDISVDEELISKKCNEIIFRNLSVLGLTTLIAAIFVVLCSHYFSDVSIIKAAGKRFYLTLFLIIFGSQIVYTFYNVEYLTNRYKDIAIFLDFGTVMLISFIFITELLFFMSIFIDNYAKSKILKFETYSVIRPDAFVYQVALALPISFIPLHAGDIYIPISGLSQEFVIGLPVSINMLCTMIAFLAGGSWMDRRGWQSLHLWGIFLTSAGALLCGITHSIVEFILYRGLVGFGYGLTFMSYMGFVYSNTDSENRTMGFATMSAGMFSGHLCGGAIGGMLAEKVGFSPVFIISFILMIPAVIFPFLFMRHAYQKKSEPIRQTYSDKKADIRAARKFLLNRNILSLLLFMSIPSSIVFAGLLYYLCPIYLDRLGVSQANIARLLMINALSMIYLSPLISPAIDRSPSKKTYLVISGIIGSFGLLSFYYLKGVPAMILAIIMTSLSTGIGNSSRPVYALQQKVALELGGGKAMGIYRTADRIGWVMGPVIFGSLIALKDVNMGLTTTGLVYLILTLIFIIISSEKEKIVRLHYRKKTRRRRNHENRYLHKKRP